MEIHDFLLSVVPDQRTIINHNQFAYSLVLTSTLAFLPNFMVLGIWGSRIGDESQMVRLAKSSLKHTTTSTSAVKKQHGWLIYG